MVVKIFSFIKLYLNLLVKKFLLFHNTYNSSQEALFTSYFLLYSNLGECDNEVVDAAAALKTHTVRKKITHQKYPQHTPHRGKSSHTTYPQLFHTILVWIKPHRKFCIFVISCKMKQGFLIHFCIREICAT